MKIFGKKKKKNDDEFKEYLIDFRDYCQGRLDRGDLDFDDWVYRGRAAAQDILDHYFGMR